MARQKEYVYGATEAVAYEHLNGARKPAVRVVVHIDEPWDASDPVVKKRPDLFQPEPFDARGTVKGIE